MLWSSTLIGWAVAVCGARPDRSVKDSTPPLTRACCSSTRRRVVGAGCAAGSLLGKASSRSATFSRPSWAMTTSKRGASSWISAKVHARRKRLESSKSTNRRSKLTSGRPSASWRRKCLISSLNRSGFSRTSPISARRLSSVCTYRGTEVVISRGTRKNPASVYARARTPTTARVMRNARPVPSRRSRRGPRVGSSVMRPILAHPGKASTHACRGRFDSVPCDTSLLARFRPLKRVCRFTVVPDQVRGEPEISPRRRHSLAAPGPPRDTPASLPRDAQGCSGRRCCSRRRPRQ